MKKIEKFIRIDVKKREKLARLISTFLIITTLTILGFRYIMEFLITNQTNCALDAIDTTCGLVKLGVILAILTTGFMIYLLLFVLLFLFLPRYDKVKEKEK